MSNCLRSFKACAAQGPHAVHHMLPQVGCLSKHHATHCSAVSTFSIQCIVKCDAYMPCTCTFSTCMWYADVSKIEHRSSGAVAASSKLAQGSDYHTRAFRDSGRSSHAAHGNSSRRNRRPGSRSSSRSTSPQGGYRRQEARAGVRASDRSHEARQQQGSRQTSREEGRAHRHGQDGHRGSAVGPSNRDTGSSDRCCAACFMSSDVSGCKAVF